MLSYLFLKQVPISLLFDLLEKICSKTDHFYMIDMNAYKKMLFHEYHLTFCENLTPYYHISKRYYLTRELTYNSFTNIIRQICKSNKHHFYTELKYDFSIYTILFFVAIPPAITTTTTTTEEEIKEQEDL
jgi:hypothetical protein